MSGIYCIENLVSGGMYVGSAAHVLKRCKEHHRLLKRFCHHNRHLQNAWNKYGSQAFCFYVLEIVDDVDKLLEREQHYIDLLKPRYNIRRLAAGTNLGVKWSEKTLRRMSEAKVGEKNTFYGRTHSDEVKARFSKQRKGRKLTEEWKKNIGEGCRGEKNGMFGKTHTPEVRERLRQAALGSRCANAKFTEDTVKEVIEQIAQTDVSLNAIARKFNVTSSTIGAINAGKTWSHVCSGFSYPLRRKRGVQLCLWS